MRKISLAGLTIPLSNSATGAEYDSQGKRERSEARRPS